MTGDLRGVRLKIDRAHEHLTTLDATVREMSAGREIVGHIDDKAGEYVLRVSGEPPDDGLGVIVGEFAHNLRSALDNLFWQLVIANNGTPTDKTQFPIFEDERTKTGELSKRAVARILRPVGNDGTVIQDAQPHIHGDKALRQPLALLAHLNNVDKHRYLHPAFVCFTLRVFGERPIPLYEGAAPYLNISDVRSTRLNLPIPWRERDVRVHGWRYTSGGDDRTELMRFSVTVTGPEPEVEVQPGVSVAVSLSDTERPMLINDLWAIRQEVQRIYDALRASIE